MTLPKLVLPETSTYKEFPEWRIVEIIDDTQFIVTCDHDVYCPMPGFPQTEPWYREKYVVIVDGLNPQNTDKASVKTNFFQVQGVHYARAFPVRDEIGEAYKFHWGTAKRQKVAIEFVQYHLLHSALKFDAHNYLYCFLNLKVKQVVSLKLHKNKVFVSYLFEDRTGKGSTILSLKKIQSYSSDEVIGYLPIRDEYFYQDDDSPDAFVLAGYQIFKRGDEEIIFVTASCQDHKGFTRINQLPQPLPEDLATYFLIDVDRLSHCYSACFCFYDAIFSFNQGEYQAYKGKLVKPLANGFGTGNNDNKKPKSKKKK